MTEQTLSKQRFAEILRKQGYNSFQINVLWRAKPETNLTESHVKNLALEAKILKEKNV